MDLTILLPCLNESETIATCVKKSIVSIQESGLSGEVLVADNGSSDGSANIASELGARVIHVPKRGYGSALITGIEHSLGKYIIMGDADDSYALDKLGPFISQLENGFDIVMGNRFLGGIEKGAMPWLHRYVGNPILSWLGRLFFKVPINDFHCGLRGFRRDSILKLNLRSTGMEFASEMVVKAQLNGLKITEVPTKLRPDGRSRAPHLRTWRDGWRHLIFLFSASPRWFYFYPAMTIGAVGFILILFSFFASNISTLSMFLIGLGFNLINVGSLIAFLGFIARVFSTHMALIPGNKRSRLVSKYFNFQNGILIGGFFILLGATLFTTILYSTSRISFSLSSDRNLMFFNSMSLSFLSLGFQLLFASFLASLMESQRKSTSN